MDESTLVIVQSSPNLITSSDQLWKSLDQVETLRKLPDCIKNESKRCMSVLFQKIHKMCTKSMRTTILTFTKRASYYSQTLGISGRVELDVVYCHLCRGGCHLYVLLR